MNRLWVVQFRRHECKHWRNKSAHFRRINAQFEVRQLKSEYEDCKHAAEYRIVEFTAKK